MILSIDRCCHVSDEIGLAWRKTSPRKTDFVQFAQLLLDVAPQAGKL
jgi:hypothetical protein